MERVLPVYTAKIAGKLSKAPDTAVFG
jgi:hypothetical protein